MVSAGCCGHRHQWESIGVGRRLLCLASLGRRQGFTGGLMLHAPCALQVMHIHAHNLWSLGNVQPSACAWGDHVQHGFIAHSLSLLFKSSGICEPRKGEHCCLRSVWLAVSPAICKREQVSQMQRNIDRDLQHVNGLWWSEELPMF